MSALFRNRFKPDSSGDRNVSTTQSVTASGDIQVSDGDLKYVGQQGGNNAPVGYQEASGAPVEVQSPLGYAVGPVTILFLNLSKMVGTGIFSTRECREHIVLCEKASRNADSRHQPHRFSKALAPSV